MPKRVKAVSKPAVHLSSNHRQTSPVAAEMAMSAITTEAIQHEFFPTPANVEIGLDVAVRAAQQQTGAVSAALALTQGQLLVCRARVGRIAPALGAPLDKTVGITGACVRTGKALYCSDAETDPRVDSCLCRQLNIRSILVVPILKAKTVTGLVEVLSPEVDAFDASHVRWLIQLAQFIQALIANANLPPPQPTTPACELVPETTDEEGEVEQPKKAGEAVSRPEDSEKTDIAAIRDVLNRVDTATWDEISQELGARFEDSQEPSKQAHDNIPRIGNQKSKWTALFWSR
jgi:putative methionine-R-sulfoxide reductase with GAF domain